MRTLAYMKSSAMAHCRHHVLGVFILALLQGTTWYADASHGRLRYSEHPARDDEAGHRCYSTPRINGSDEHNPLWTFFNAREKGPGIHKWIQYFDIYHRFFGKFVGKEVYMMEIGVQSGGSLDLWRHYFGDKLILYGIDINPYAKALFNDPPHTNIFIGDQENRTFWAEVRSKVPRIDILLDDGGHTAQQQITTFEEMYDFVSQDGIYMIEDVSPATGPGSLLAYTRQHVADIFGHFNKDTLGLFRSSEPSKFTTTTIGISFYDMQIVYEKGQHMRPLDAVQKGKFWLPYTADTASIAPGRKVNLAHVKKFQQELTRSWT